MRIFAIVIIIMIIAYKVHDNSNGVVGETRVVTKFLLKPTIIKSDKRFFKKCTIKQEYYKTPCGDYCWVNKEWLD